RHSRYDNKTHPLKLSYLLNFRLQPHAELLFYPVRHIFHKLRHLCCGRVPPVDHKPAVFFRYLGISHTLAPEPCILDQLPCEIAFRAFKRTPGASIFQGLFSTLFSFSSSIRARICSCSPLLSFRTAPSAT